MPRNQAVAALKETLIQRFGSDFKDVIESEVEGRLEGRSKLERQDLDAIERVVTATRRERRGGKPLAGKGLTRSAPDLQAVSQPAAPARRPVGSSSSPALDADRRTAPQTAPQIPPPKSKKVRRPAPYAVSILDEDAMSDRSRVEVKPKYFVPLPPKLKPMDHWDLIVAYDTNKYRKEYETYVKAGKHEQQSKVKHILDEQMKECHKLFEASEKKRRQERQDMLDQIKENQRLSQAEQAQRDALRDKAKAINESSLESLRRRRKADEERRQREQDTMLKWMRDENQRQQDQRKADAEEYARKCKQAQDEMNEAIAEAARKKKARQDEDKAFAMAGEKAADDAEARNRAAVQARLDQIDRNCEIIGAEIAGRDAKLEAELQAKIQKIQEDADRAAKEDAERRKADRDAKVRSMLDSLDMQMKQREEDVRQEKQDSIKQAMIFKREYEEGLANDRAKEERARQAREDMGKELVAIMRRNARIHPRDFGAEPETPTPGMAPKRGSIEAAFAGKAKGAKSKKAGLEQSTPESKPSVGAADVTPSPEMPKRRRLEKAPETTPTKPKVQKDVEMKAPPADVKISTSHGPSETGPWSLWSGASSKGSKDLASASFDPRLLESEFPVGKAVGFALLSSALLEIEEQRGKGQGSRKRMTVVLSNLFRFLIHVRPQDLIASIYILINKVAPDYEAAELGVGDSIIIKALCENFGRSESTIKHALATGEAKDLGEVALQSRLSQKMLMMPPKLSIEKVFAEMKAIAHASGKDSQKSKKEKIQKLLVASRGEEAKFIVRMLQAKLRIGIQIPTLLQALAYAFTLTQPGPAAGPANVTDRRLGQGKLSPVELESQMVAMEAAVRQAFSEMPNFDNLIKALMEGRNSQSLLEVCRISLGVPVKPMLAKPSKGIAEVGERLSGKRFTGEWKYDGERAQIHVLSRDTIQIYSRNSENMTEKYPDVIQVVKETLAQDVESCIIDSELVAYDQVNKKILPFQVLTTRGRKNINVEDIKVNVCLFAFDCMLVNGKPLVKEPLEVRREKLWKMLAPMEGKVTFAVYKNFDDINEEEIQAFLDESVAGSCEGLMLKTLTDNATYEPSKRSLNWLKLKKDYLEGMADSIDVVPIGAYYGKGKRSGAYGAYLLAVYDQENEEFQTVCKAGTGFSDEDLQTHYKFFKEHLRGCAETNYNVNDKLKPDVWLEPYQVWEIRAADLSISPVHTSAFGVKADGKGIGLRFPRFLRIRDDKTAEESTGPEQIVEMFESQASVGGQAMADDDF